MPNLLNRCAAAGLDTVLCDGRSTAIHRLVRDFGRAKGPYAFLDTIANRKLAEVLLDGARLRTPDEVLPQLLPDPGADGGPVRFLPRDRLLSAAERQFAREAFGEVLTTGETTSGPHVERFEAELAQFLDVRQVIGTSSGTDAMVIALAALGVTCGDEVIIPANSFAATENAVLAVGAVPVLADVDPVDANLDPGAVSAAVTARTKAVIPVHLNGRLADVIAMRAVADEYGLWLLEDACQAIGLDGVGEHSHAVALSFNPFKNFGLPGKAGAITTDNEALAVRCREIGYHGFSPGRKNEKTAPFGLNARIDNTMAAIGLRLLPHLSLNNFKRAYLAHRYLEGLRPLALRGRILLPEATGEHVWHLFAVQVPDGRSRDAVRAELLTDSAVETDVFYPVLTHRQKAALDNDRYRPASVPNTEGLNNRLVNLPLYNNLSIREQDRVIEAVHAVLG